MLTPYTHHIYIVHIPHKHQTFKFTYITYICHTLHIFPHIHIPHPTHIRIPKYTHFYKHTILYTQIPEMLPVRPHMYIQLEEVYLEGHSEKYCERLGRGGV